MALGWDTLVVTYDLLKEAGLSWHRTQAINPKKKEDLVLLKREEIKKNWRSIRPQ